MPAAPEPRQPAAPWFHSEAGTAVLASEAAAARALLGVHPAGSWLWLAPSGADLPAAHGRGLPLVLAEGELRGLLRCGLPLPIASDALGCVVLQHLPDLLEHSEALLAECARVLLPGGVLGLFALNPASPYRWHWQRHGMRVAEPVTWRRRLRKVGLAPEAVSLGLGPRWRMQLDAEAQHGAGLRAAFLLQARKQVAALTPLRPLRIGKPVAVPAA